MRTQPDHTPAHAAGCMQGLHQVLVPVEVEVVEVPVQLLAPLLRLTPTAYQLTPASVSQIQQVKAALEAWLPGLFNSHALLGSAS